MVRSRASVRCACTLHARRPALAGSATPPHLEREAEVLAVVVHGLLDLWGHATEHGAAAAAGRHQRSRLRARAGWRGVGDAAWCATPLAACPLHARPCLLFSKGRAMRASPSIHAPPGSVGVGPHLVERLVQVLLQRDLGVEKRRRLADLAVGKVGDHLCVVVGSGGVRCGWSARPSLPAGAGAAANRPPLAVAAAIAAGPWSPCRGPHATATRSRKPARTAPAGSAAHLADELDDLEVVQVGEVPRRLRKQEVTHQHRNTRAVQRVDSVLAWSGTAGAWKWEIGWRGAKVVLRRRARATARRGNELAGQGGRQTACAHLAACCSCQARRRAPGWRCGSSQ